MALQCKKIDMETYPRRDHFDYFRSLQNPHVGVTVDVDVTDLVRFCRDNGYSLYLSFMHAAALAADGVEQFRQRIRDGGIVEYSECGTSHTESTGDGRYCYCTLYHHMPFGEYIEYAENERKLCREQKSIEEDENVEAMYFITSLPWLHYSDLSQPTGGRDDSNPRMSWGKYEEDFRGRLMLPVTVLCNHAVVDGINVAEFYQKLDEEIKIIVSNNC